MDDELNYHLERLKKKIGYTSEPHVYRVDLSSIQKFAIAIGDDNPLYFDEDYAKSTRFGGIVAPMSFVSVFINTPLLRGDIFDMDIPLKRMLHSDDVVEVNDRIRPGDVITTSTRYADVYIRENPKGVHFYQTAEMTMRDANRKQIAIVKLTSIGY